MATYEHTTSIYDHNSLAYSSKSPSSHCDICADGGRESVTFKLDAETLKEIDQETDERDITRSEYLREIIDSRYKTDDLQAEIRAREQMIERLENEKRTLIQNRKEHTELVEYVQEEREIQRQRQNLEYQRAEAGLLTRTKWWMFGMKSDDTSDQ